MKELEQWKACKYYEELYQISDRGRIWDIKNQSYIKGGFGSEGVLLVAKNGKEKLEKRSRLVALTFLPNTDTNKTKVSHINKNKQDNRVSNLEWISRDNHESQFKHR